MMVQKELRKRNGRYAVYSSEGKKLSKWYATRAEALKRLREIEYFKHHKEYNGMPDLNGLADNEIDKL